MESDPEMRFGSTWGQVDALFRVKALSGDEKDALKNILREVLQRSREGDDRFAGAGKSERSPARLGYRSGYYERSLITRVGKLELRVPQDGMDTFQPSYSSAIKDLRKRWYRPWPRCTCKGYQPERSRQSQRSCAAIRFRPLRSVQ